ANQDALVEAVSKGSLGLAPETLKALGIDLLADESRILPFTPLEEIEKAVLRTVESLDFEALAARHVGERLERLRGRV
ncbi:MAG TPA: hypothetical protein VFA18_19910, partial [Gemmataceae bacterium]|nr:hypothetical protein [Gemmataceae bacterium]